MEIAKIILMVVSALLAFLTTGIPSLIALKKAWKARTVAETDTAKEKADADLLAAAKSFIANAEGVYDGMDKLMKPNGDTAGGVKRENVFIKLQAYALQHGYEFDAEKWSAVIDELVEFTKNVNYKKGA